MPTVKRPHVALIGMFGMLVATVALAAPANAEPYVKTPPPTVILPEVVTAPTAPLPSGGTDQLASTGSNMVGFGAAGGLLIVGGGLTLFAGRRRKVNA